MNIKDLENKLVAVLGYRQEGRAVTKYLIKHGVKPVLFDENPWEKWSVDEQKEIKKLEINYIFGQDCFKKLAEFDVAFRSPGIPLSHPDLLLWPNLTVASQTKFFFDNCPCKIIGVTGTKGKGTTASLIYEILSLPLRGVHTTKQANNRSLANARDDARRQIASLPTVARNDNPQVYLTGNIGKDQPLDILDDLKKDDWVVYELSSFQLQDLEQSPHIGVVLMITQEHLDYHKDNQEYIDAKSAITKFQTGDDFTVINADFENSTQIGKQGKGQKNYFSTKKNLEEGCFVTEGKIFLKVAGKVQLAFPISALQLKGAHNLQNVCAAILTGHLAGSDDEVAMVATIGFKGLEHRLELVAEKNGIKFYNDSFSTTPETAIAAILSFNEPLIAILGGSSKHSNFTELGKTIRDSKNIKALILIGQEAKRIKEAIILSVSPLKVRGGEGGLLMLEGAGDMNKIFSQIKSVANPGDVVLLSPACASFDMFKNYQDRGEQYKNCVNNF